MWDKYFVTTDTRGEICHYKGMELHREDGPAITLSNGYEEWYLNGKRHREDGPAILGPDDNTYTHWYLHGKRHREDGPSVYREDDIGTKFWNLNGVQYSWEEYDKEIRERLMLAG